tara:strand:+ start:104554 stop:105228 length:675 start_codon:yes stop_codon:yes gene_type:complete
MANKNKLWILEDDKGCQFVYEQILNHDFDISYFDNIKNFRDSIKRKKELPAMVIADLMLTDGNFLNYLTQEVHEELGNEIPFIVVSSSDDIDTLRECFKQGANDYITKPFKKNELLVKVETILRGNKSLTKSLKPKVTIDGKVIEGLTQKQIKLVELFLNNEERVVEREDMVVAVWGDTVVHHKTLDVHLYNLRRKLHPYGFMIKSIGGGKWTLLSDRIDLSKS